MILYSQRDPRWANHALGWGPALGTIGEYGCFDTVLAMIANDSGHPVDPAGIDVLFTNARVFVREPSGTFDLLPDNALAELFPSDYQASTYWGWRGDLVAMAIPTPNIYSVLWISTAAVPTHFVLAYSADGRLIADPWTGQVGALAGYGGPGAVRKTLLVTRIPTPPAPPPSPSTAPSPQTTPTPVPTSSPPPPPNPTPPPIEPVPPPVPPPMALYRFIPNPPDDNHPPDEVTTLADAIELADEYVAGQPAGTVLIVEDGNGSQLYQAGGTALEA